MSWRIVVLILLAILGGGFAILANINVLRMIRDINASPERLKSFRDLGFYPGKGLAIRAEYRRLFTKGPLLGRDRLYVAAVLVSFCLFVLTLLTWPNG